MKVLFLFLDGVGLGADDPTANPLFAAAMPFLRRSLGGPLTESLARGGDAGARSDSVVFRPLDAALGHPGLPQSATGQATLLTGVNGAEVMEGHYGPWPGPTLKRLLEKGSLFTSVSGSGSALLANAYPPGYFEAIASRRARVNVPVHAALAAGLELLDLGRYSAGEAIAADLTGRYFTDLDPRLPTLTAEEAGGRLAALAQLHEFTFFDFWLSDRVGHRGSFAEAVSLAQDLDLFLAGVAGSLGEVTLLVTSDHGNFEDKTTRGHTRAQVPLIAMGPGRAAFAGCRRLEDVAPTVRELLS